MAVLLSVLLSHVACADAQSQCTGHECSSEYLSMIQVNKEATQMRANAIVARPGLCPGQKRKPRAKGPKGLTLIHIPRTGGTSIEECSRGESKGNRWGNLAPDLKLHGNKAFGCYVQHTPPNLVQYYQGKDTFCVVRNPYTRLISEFGYMAGMNWGSWGEHSDSIDILNEKLLVALQEAQDKAKTHDCHLLPQAAYVYGWDDNKSSVDMSKKHCDNVLRFEPKLDKSFNRLMKKYGYTYRLQHKSSAGTHSNDKFKKLKPKHLSRPVLDLVNKMWAKDFKLFKYKML